jgi:hypothetical protein
LKQRRFDVRGTLFSIAAGLLLPALSAPSARGDSTSCDINGSCASYGTSVNFVDTPSLAAQQAKKEQKLVFVLHVSGHFEDPKLT